MFKLILNKMLIKTLKKRKFVLNPQTLRFSLTSFLKHGVPFQRVPYLHALISNLQQKLTYQSN